MTRQRLYTLAAVAAVLLGTGGSVLIARSGDRGHAAAPRPSASSSAPVKVLVPGRPGESAKVTDSNNVQAPDGSTYNTVDSTFVQMMIAHHGQAMTMAALAPERAADSKLKAFADRMRVAQKLEVDYFRTWLKDRGLPESDPAHDHATMPGMQTPAAIDQLTAARGAEFDRLFVTMMTAHHRGAQQMAGDVLRAGSDQRLNELANELAVEQVSEIRRMAELGVG